MATRIDYYESSEVRWVASGDLADYRMKSAIVPAVLPLAWSQFLARRCVEDLLKFRRKVRRPFHRHWFTAVLAPDGSLRRCHVIH